MTTRAPRNAGLAAFLLPMLILATGASVAGVGHAGHDQDHMGANHMDKREMPGDHDMGHRDAPSHDDGAIGRPGNPEAVARNIEIEARDIAFDVTQLTIKPGTTVRFVIRNTGKLPHEFVLGTASEQAEHAKEMQGMMPGMKHDDPNAVTVEPGQTAELIWQFSEQPQQIEYACHVPGHFEAGMLGKIDLR